MSGTFTIPEIRCNRHFYGALLCAMQAQAPINEGIVAIEPCGECLENAREDLSAENARLREALDRAVQDIDSGWATEADERFPWLHAARAALAEKGGAE